MWNVESSEPNIALWTDELARYTVTDLRRAFRSIIDAGGKSPPTLPEVRSLCRGRAVDAQERSGSPIDTTVRDGPTISKERAAENRARLQRILAGVELEVDKHCVIGHLSPALKQRFRESASGYPTHRGHAIAPAYISDPAQRERYEAEIEEWRAANVGT